MSDRDKMALIFMPGVSTAEKVSDVSGRGVGMDVVKTNLDRLGGKIEIDSAPGRGTRFRIKLPADSGHHSFATGFRRRRPFRHSAGQCRRIDPHSRARRLAAAHGPGGRRRSPDTCATGWCRCSTWRTPSACRDRETSSRALNVVLVDTGAFEYGLVVDELHDTVEIVVKPLGRHLKGLHDYAGATILGDGRVAVILDVAGLAARAQLSRTRSIDDESRFRKAEPRERARGRTARVAAVPQHAVARIARSPSNRFRASNGCAPHRSSTSAAAAPCSTVAPACLW